MEKVKRIYILIFGFLKPTKTLGCREVCPSLLRLPKKATNTVRRNGGGVGTVCSPTFLEIAFVTLENNAAQKKFSLSCPPRYNFLPTVLVIIRKLKVLKKRKVKNRPDDYSPTITK